MGAVSKALAALAAFSLAAAGAAPAAAQSGRVISPDWFAGTWSDNADCSEPVQFYRDGRYRTPAGDEARWRIERGNVLVLEGAGGRQELAIERIGERQIRTIDGGVNSYRCDSRAPLPLRTTAVTAEWLIGTWSDPRDCSEPFYITRDGGFRAPNGALGRWTLQGDRLTLTFGQNTQTVRIIRVSDNELKLAETGVSSYRCR